MNERDLHLSRLQWAAEDEPEPDARWFLANPGRRHLIRPRTQAEYRLLEKIRGKNQWSPVYYVAVRLEFMSISFRFLWFHSNATREFSEAEAREIFENGAGQWDYFFPFYQENWSPPK